MKINDNLGSPLASLTPAQAQQIIWREWRNCEDEEYAHHLFELVVDEPVNWWAIVISGLLGLIYGAVAGLLLSLLPGQEMEIIAVNQGIFWGGIIGGGSGLLISLWLTSQRQLAWGAWFNALIPNHAWLGEPNLRPLSAPFARLIISLASGLGVGLPGLLLLGYPQELFSLKLTELLAPLSAFILGMVAHRQFNRPVSINMFIALLGALYCALTYFAISSSASFSFWALNLIGISSGLCFGYYYSQKVALLEVLAGSLVGLLFGMFFGLGFAWSLDQLIGPLDYVAFGGMVGLAVGIGAGWYFGREAGFMGLLIGQTTALVLALVAGFDIILNGWLLGLLIGGLVGNSSRIWFRSTGSLQSGRAFAYRAWCLWWSERPYAAEIIAALRQYATARPWSALLHQLQEVTDSENLSEVLITDMQSSDWGQRFIARYSLIGLGGQQVPRLAALARQAAPPMRETLTWVARNIGRETSKRLAPEAKRQLCPHCLTCCGPYTVEIQPEIFAHYYGCRTCGRSRELLYCPRGVAATLDTEAWPQMHRWQDGLLQVNWLARQALFDFDQIEIIRATDEDVERFTVQAGNDTDAFRRPGYALMRCLIAPDCRLSENTLRIWA